MTAFTLLLYITLAILAQATVFAVVVVVRLRRARELELAATGVVATAPLPTAEIPAWEGWREFRVQRRAVEDESDSVRSFYLIPVDGKPLPSFKPGQYLTFQLSVKDPVTLATRNVVRCYSLSDAPNPDHYRVSIKRVLAPADKPGAAPGVASNYFHDRVLEGAVLLVKAPAGHFHLLPESRGPVVLVAGGIGITPLLSMLKAALRVDPDREIWLFYALRSGAEYALRQEIESLARTHRHLYLHACFSRPRERDILGADYRHAGRLDAMMLRVNLPLRDFHFYVCGPGPMMRILVPALEEWGVPEARLHFEAFGPATVSRAKTATAPGAAVVDVTFSKSGKRLRWDGNASSLLEFCEANSIVVTSGCRAGGCGACQTKVEAGEVTYTRPPDFDSEPGKCLLCVSTPKTDITLSA